MLASLSRTLGRVRGSKDFGLGQIWLKCCSKHNGKGEWLGLALSGRMRLHSTLDSLDLGCNIWAEFM